MDELMEKYEERFGECFPLMLTRGMSEKQIGELINDCLEKDKPYEVGEKEDY